MSMYDKRLRDIDKALDDMVTNPQDFTIADYARLTSERSAILHKMEAEDNLNSKAQKIKEIRDAISRVINE